MVVGSVSPTAGMSGTSIIDFATDGPAPNPTLLSTTRSFRPPRNAHKPGSRTRSPARCTTTPKDDQSKALSRKMLTASRIRRRTDGVPSHLDFVPSAGSLPITSYEPISIKEDEHWRKEDEHYRGKIRFRTDNLSDGRYALECSWLERKKATRSFGHLHTTQLTDNLALPYNSPGRRVSSLTIDPNIYAIPEDSCTGPAPVPECIGSIRPPGDTFKVPSVPIWERQGLVTKRTWTNWKRTRLPPGGHCPWTKEMLDKAWASLGGPISEETESEEDSKNGIKKSWTERFR